MKKIYFILAAAAMFLAVEANAQLGVGVGYNHINTVQKMADESDDESLDGFYIEATYDLNFLDANWGSLGLQPALRYTFGGDSESEEILGVNTRVSIAEHYLDIPVRIKFAMDVMPNLRAFVYAGPTLDFGLSSKYQCRARLSDDQVGKYTYNYYSGKNKVSTIPGFEASNPSSVYRRFDVDMGFAIGAEIYDIATVKLGLDWGLINKNKNRNIADYLITNRNTFYLGLGVRF